jgi:hypothetical protein
VPFVEDFFRKANVHEVRLLRPLWVDCGVNMIKILGRGSDTIGEFEGSRCVMTAKELSLGGSWLADPSAAVIWQDWGILLLERGSVSGQNKLKLLST